MSELLQAIFLGIVQGLTEFLPISSSAHLALAPWLLGFEPAFLHSLAFDVALHMGTLVAVLLYFWRDWWQMAAAGLGVLFRRRPWHDAQARLLGYVVVGSVPGAIAGLLLEPLVEDTFREPLLMAGTLAGFGLLLGLVDRWAGNTRMLDKATWRDALLIGIAQALALVPGVSRSGITITAGLALGLTREAAARFGFLLLAPVVAGAGLLEGAELLGTGLPGDELAAFIAGTVAAAAVAMAVISLLLRYLRSHRLWPFVAYRLALAALVVAVVMTHGL